MNASPTAAPGSDATGKAALDATALARLRELDPTGKGGVVMRVLAAYETSLVRLLGQLESQLDAPDGAVIAAVAHTLKSSSASVGALDLARACEQVEKRLRSGQPAQRHDVEALSSQGQAALVAVRAMLGR